MTVSVFGVVLFAAVLHALWNSLVKSAPDKFLSTVLVTTSASLFSLVFLPFLPVPDVASWVFIGLSTCLQVLYYWLVARLYHRIDIGQAYPIMRGGAPLLVALFNLVVHVEKMPVTAWLGIFVICGGILFIAFSRSRKPGAGIGEALMVSVLIASYTVIDGMGVRLSHAPAAYTLWIFLLTGLPLAGWMMISRPKQITDYARQHWRYGALGGISTVISYGLALWAMTRAPIPVVAALRETSILFVTLISVFILRETVSRARITGAMIIAVGAILIRLFSLIMIGSLALPGPVGA